MTDHAPLSTSSRPVTGGKRFTQNVVWSFAGQCLPIGVALFTIPLLIRQLGVDRFGILSLAWVLTGYFGLLDLGMGRALSQAIAKRIGTSEEDDTPTWIGVALLLVCVLGTAGVILLNLLAPWIVLRLLKIPEALQAESLQSLRLLAWAIPCIMISSALRGVMEVRRRFGAVNLLRIATGTLIFLGPVVVLSFSDSLVAVMAALVATRALDAALHLSLCAKNIRMPGWGDSLSKPLHALLSFGGWITLSNLIGPILIYLDRLIIGAQISVSAVAYYSVPYDMVSHVGAIPAAMTLVLFPIFATNPAAEKSGADTSSLFHRSVRYTLLVLFPLTLLIVTFAGEGLALWIDADFARQGARVLQWLAVGRFINGLAQIPTTFLQGIGRPDLPAKFHAVELPFYALAVWGFTSAFGLVGTAVAWLLRVTIDTLLLFMASARFMQTPAIGNIGRITALATGLLVIGMIPDTPVEKSLFLLMGLGLFGWGSYRALRIEGETTPFALLCPSMRKTR
jgi:O-antigen/teichoic acid export membrane protein